MATKKAASKVDRTASSLVFIGWSGERSKLMAGTLKHWLQQVIQTSDPWVSTQDIGSGAPWNQELLTALRAACFGVLCVTPDNHESPWLNYECGVLVGRLDSNVCPLLLDVNINDLTSTPLSRQQARPVTDESEMLKLVLSINDTLEERAVRQEAVKSAFEKNWPDLKFPKSAAEAPRKRSLEDKVDELLTLVQAVNTTVSSSTVQLSDEPIFLAQYKNADEMRAALAADVARTEREQTPQERRALQNKLREAMNRRRHRGD